MSSNSTSSASEIQILYSANTEKSIGGITIDAFISEEYHHSAEVTELPIEDGSTISDHIVQNPDELQIEGIVGNTDIKADYSNSSAPVNRAGEYYEKLLTLKEAGNLITVVCGLRSWSNMAITDLAITRNTENGKALCFTMSLKKVKKITSEQVTVSTAGGTTTSTNTKKQVQSKAEIGKTSTTTVTNSTQKSSWLANIKSQLGVS